MSLRSILNRINPLKYKVIHGGIEKIEIVDDKITFITISPITGGRNIVIPYYKALEIEWGNFQVGKFITITEKPFGFFRDHMIQEIVGLDYYDTTIFCNFQEKDLRREYSEYLKE
jgi:hypothetical protein